MHKTAARACKDTRGELHRVLIHRLILEQTAEKKPFLLTKRLKCNKEGNG
jgi:hypothetical protein